MKNLYETLDIDKQASKEDIKKAFRKKAKKSHPDHGGNAEEFKEVNMAYLTLIDDKKREYYDKTGEQKEEQVHNSNYMKDAMSSLSSDFDRLLQNAPMLYKNISSIIKMAIKRDLQNLLSGIQSTKYAEDLATKIYDKFTFLKKNNIEDVLEQTYINRIRQIRQDRLRMIQTRRMLLRKMWILKCYKETCISTETLISEQITNNEVKLKSSVFTSLFEGE